MTNAYHRREVVRLAKRHDRRNAEATNKLVEIDHFCKAYEDAFFDYHLAKVKVTHSHGWYYISYAKLRVRQRDIIQLTASLLAAFHERELNDDSVLSIH